MADRVNSEQHDGVRQFWSPDLGPCVCEKCLTAPGAISHRPSQSAPVRTSYAAVLERAMGYALFRAEKARIPAVAATAHADVEALRSLAALIARAERAKALVESERGYGALNPIVAELAAGFTASPSLDGGAQK